MCLRLGTGFGAVGGRTRVLWRRGEVEYSRRWSRDPNWRACLQLRHIYFDLVGSIWAVVVSRRVVSTFPNLKLKLQVGVLVQPMKFFFPPRSTSRSINR